MREQRAIGLLNAERGKSVNLLAGQLWFGHEAASVHTLLGSCVAITLWHPGRRMGGMCHFLLPQRKRAANEPLDCRYGDEAVWLMVQALRQAGSRPEDFEAHLYGGADTMPGHAQVKFNIGERNIEQGWRQVQQHGFALQSIDVGDHVPRRVSLDLSSGAVQMRRGTTHRQAPRTA